MKKMKLTRSLLAACSVVALTAVMYGCVHSGGDDEPEPPVVTPDPPPDPGPTDLEETQADAAAAAAAAGDAATEAADDAKAAADATANIATLQTGEMAKAAAMGASEAAHAAMAAYRDAKAASDDAAAATTGADAEAAWAKADAAKKVAEAAAMTADEMSAAAIAAAMTELQIDDSVKSVGDSSVDAMAELRSVTTGSDTEITGLIESLNPMGTSGAITGRARTDAVVDDLGTADDETAAAIPYLQTAAERTFAIGKTLDSSDDMARLMIVTDYPGRNMVRPFAQGGAGSDVMGTKAGYITIEDDGTPGTDVNNVVLRSEGMFMPAGDGDGTLDNTDSISATAELVEVFSYVDPTDDMRKYATLTTSSTDAAGDTTYTYNSGADITAASGGPDSATDGDALPDDAQVTVPIPGPVAYEHLHFGVWAALGDASAAGAQDIVDMGIGFVQSIGDGPTGADLPNVGSASYSGNWVAVVLQGAGDDSMALEHGAANLTADFDDDKFTAALMGLATLSGDIDGNGFSGDTATAAVNNSYGLTPGSFDGEFSGGFYGSEGAEAGGVFDFNGGDNGAFRGAFGGAKDDD